MATAQWNDALRVGHAVIDRNHLELVGVINELGDAMSCGRGRDVCGKVLDELTRCTKEHFATEEQLMTAHRFAAASDHRREHANLTQKAIELKDKCDSRTTTLSVDVLHFLMGWLIHHSLESEKALAQGVSYERC